MEPQQSQLGLFVSYNEDKQGDFQNVLDVCNAQQYVVWLEKTAVKTQRFMFPTTILIKIAGEDRYYRGKLRDMKRTEEVDRASLLAEAAHRPATWRAVDQFGDADFKTVLYVEELKQVPRPVGIAKENAPQHPHYVAEAILNDFLADELEQARAEQEEQAAFNPLGIEDERKRILAAIVVRQGRRKFREELLAAYQDTCAVTGCDVVEALEAAHIVPYLGPKTDEVCNGLLLRGDIHTLFDLYLITPNPSDYRLLVSKRLKGRCYESLSGHLIRLPADRAHFPSVEALEARLSEFRKKEGN